MAQYDLLLTQNVSAAGTEFSEKYVNLGKGDLLSGIATTKVPTVLAAGTNGYMLVRDDNEATGLKWIAIAAGHTQGTDTGTTSAEFDIDSDSTTGKLKLKAVANAGENHIMTLQNEAMTDDVTLTLPAVTGKLATEAYATAVLAANAAMVYKGTVGTGGDIEKAALEALHTYNAGWTYRVITAGTYFSVVCEVGDTITCIVSRAGSGDVDTDWSFYQTNLDGAVIGPASTTDNYVALFSGTTGKLLKAGSGALGTMAYEAATSYVAKALFDANTILFATSDNTPAALLGTELPPKLWAAVPADKIGTGYTGTAIAGQIAKDANFIYFCETGGAGASQVWSRTVKATNWV
jgi:hypothetical protein